MNASEIKRSRSFDKSSSTVSKSSPSLPSTPIDNTPFLQFQYPILDCYKINASKLKD